MARKRNRPGKSTGKVNAEAQRISDMLEELENYDEQFNDWETEFYESICNQFYDQGRDLTGPQVSSIERMYDRLCRSNKSFKKDAIRYNM